MDHLVIIYLLLRGTKWDLERGGSRSAYQGPLLPGFPWKTARFLSMVGFLVFAVNKADAVRDHSASNFFFGLLVLYVVWRAFRLYQMYPPPYRPSAPYRPPTIRSNQGPGGLGYYCLLQVVVLAFLTIAAEMRGEEPTMLGALVLWVAVLVVTAAYRRRELIRWWHAFDEKGRPIDVEVLPPAQVTVAD
jgi:hypothetical protein